MKLPAMFTRMLSTLALSNWAIFWATVTGIAGTLIFVPDHSQPYHFLPWLAVALAAQAAFALTIVVARTMWSSPSPVLVMVALIVGGIVRGAVIAFGGALLGLQALGAAMLAQRIMNSAVICLIGGALIGGILTSLADFRRQYRMLLDRALLLERLDHDLHTIDRSVLQDWSAIKRELDVSIDQTRELLAGGVSNANLHDAASLLSTAVDDTLRPASRAIWPGTPPDYPVVSVRSVFSATISTWQLPLREILGFFAVVVGIGAIVRVGLLQGLIFTGTFLLVTGSILGLSAIAAHMVPRRAKLIAAMTLIALPVVLVAAGPLLDNITFGGSPDTAANVIMAVQAPIFTVLIAMVVEGMHQRQHVLESLQARIDADVQSLMQSESAAASDAQNLSLFVHHSVQSELSALSLQLREATLTTDQRTREDVSNLTLERLARIRGLDAASPPWLAPDSGAMRITRIIEAWDGILDVEVSLPESDVCRHDQWQVAAPIIEEGLANAARHGDATWVRISGQIVDGALILQILDNGQGTSNALSSPQGDATSGIGLQWLDRVAPNHWSLRTDDKGSQLSVTIH